MRNPQFLSPSGIVARNAQDLAGFSPLMWAAGRDSADGVKMLLDCEVGLCLIAGLGSAIW